MSTLILPREELGKIIVRGRGLTANIYETVTSAVLEMSTDMVTELGLTIVDPDYELLNSDIFSLETPITYSPSKGTGLNLLVSVIELGEESGVPKLTTKCRPAAVSLLRSTRGKKTLKNLTPAGYIRAEVQAVNSKISVVAQEGAKRGSISRDVPEKGQTYSGTSIPSAWTTFQRLADEEGYWLYECNNTIYFGKPSWLITKFPTFTYDYKGKDELGGQFSLPEVRASLDSDEVEISLQLSLEFAGLVYPGYKLTLKNAPIFNGNYIVTNVAYPLAGVGALAVTATNIKDPTPSGVNDTGNGAGSSSGGTGTLRPGLHPIRSYEDALAYAEGQRQHPSAPTKTGQWNHYCQTFARLCVGAGPFGESARDAWLSTPSQYKSTAGPPPAGSIAYYNIGDYGHAVFSCGGGQVYSTHSSGIIKTSWTSFGNYYGYIWHCPSGDLPVQDG